MTTATITTQNASSLFNPLDTISDFFQGVVGKLETAGTMASSGSSVASGVIGSLSEVPTIVGEIMGLVTAIEGGRWTSVPADVVALLEEFDKIAGRFGLDMSALDAFVRKLPFAPAIAKTAPAKTAPAKTTTA